MADNTIAYKVLNNGVEDIYDIPADKEQEFIDDMKSSGLSPERIDVEAQKKTSPGVPKPEKQAGNLSETKNFISKDSTNDGSGVKTFQEWLGRNLPADKNVSAISSAAGRMSEKRNNYVESEPEAEKPEDNTIAKPGEFYVNPDNARALSETKMPDTPKSPAEAREIRRNYFKSALERNGKMYTDADIDRLDNDFVNNAEYNYFMRESDKLGNMSGLSDAEVKLYKSAKAKASMPNDEYGSNVMTEDERSVYEKVNGRNIEFWNSPLAKRVIDRQISERRREISDLNADMRSFENEHKIAVDDGEGGTYYKWDSPDSIKEYRMMQQARKLKLDALDTWKAPSKYSETTDLGLLKGAYNKMSDEDWWTFNLTKLSRDINIRNIFEKIEDYELKHGGLNNGGEYNIEDILTNGEQELLNAFYSSAQAESARAGNMSRSYMAGQSFADAIPFMVEFFLTDGAATAVKKSVATALEKYLGKFVSRSVGGLASAAVRTAMMPSSYAGVGDKLTELDENGKLKFSKLQASGIQALDAGIETLSESFGNALDQIGITPARLAKALEGKKFGKAVQAITDFGDKFFGDNSILKKAGFNGTIGEGIEEVYGTALRSLYSSIAGDDAFGSSSEQWRQFLGRDNVLSMVESFGLMGLIGGAFSRDDKSINNRVIKNKSKVLENILTGLNANKDMVNEFLSNFENMTMEEQDIAFSILENQARYNSNVGGATFYGEMKKATDAFLDIRRAYVGNQMIDMATERREKGRMEDAIFFNDKSDNVLDDKINGDRTGIDTAGISILGTPPIAIQAIIQRCFSRDGWKIKVGGSDFSIEHVTGNTYALKGNVGNIGANGEYLFRIKDSGLVEAIESSDVDVDDSDSQGSATEVSATEGGNAQEQPSQVSTSQNEVPNEPQAQNPDAELSDDEVVKWFVDRYGMSVARVIGGKSTGRIYQVTMDGKAVGYLIGNTTKVATIAQYLHAGEEGADGKKHNKDGWYKANVNMSDIKISDTMDEVELAREMYNSVKNAEMQAAKDEADAGNELVENEAANTKAVIDEAQQQVGADVSVPENNDVTENNGAPEGNDVNPEKQNEQSDEEFEASLPRKKNGELDYDSFAPSQTFRYTAMISGLQDAVDDAAQTVATRVSQLDALNESLKSAVGTDKLKIRAQIAKTMKEVDEYTSLIRDTQESAGIVPSQDFADSANSGNFNENNNNDNSGSNKRGNRSDKGKSSVRDSGGTGGVVRQVAAGVSENGEDGGSDDNGGEGTVVSREVSEKQESKSGGNGSQGVAKGIKVPNEAILDSEKKSNRKIDGLMKANGIPGENFPVVRVTPEEFRARMELVVDGGRNPNSWMVDVYDSYDGIDCYLSDDGLSGVAVKPDGDIISLFSGVAGQHRSNKLILFAISKGGKKLDFYTTKDKFGLQDLYSKFGAVITGWTPFNPNYVPEEHRGDTNHDVAAAYFPSTVEDAAESFNNEARADYESTPKFVDKPDKDGEVTEENTGYSLMCKDRDSKLSERDSMVEAKTAVDFFSHALSGFREALGKGNDDSAKKVQNAIRKMVGEITSKSDARAILQYIGNELSDMRQIYGSDESEYNSDISVKFLRQIQRSLKKLSFDNEKSEDVSVPKTSSAKPLDIPEREDAQAADDEFANEFRNAVESLADAVLDKFTGGLDKDTVDGMYGAIVMSLGRAASISQSTASKMKKALAEILNQVNGTFGNKKAIDEIVSDISMLSAKIDEAANSGPYESEPNVAVEQKRKSASEKPADANTDTASATKGKGAMRNITERRSGKAYKSRPYASSARGMINLVEDMDADGMVGKTRNDAVSAKLGRGIKDPSKVIAIREELRAMLGDDSLSDEEIGKVKSALAAVGKYIYDMQNDAHAARRAPYSGVILDSIDGISSSSQSKNSTAKSKMISELRAMLKKGINTVEEYIELAKKRDIFDKIYVGKSLSQNNQEDYDDFSKEYNKAKADFENKIGKNYSEIVGKEVTLSTARELAKDESASLTTMLNILDSNKSLSEDDKAEFLSKYKPEDIEAVRNREAGRKSGSKPKSSANAAEKTAVVETETSENEKKTEKEEQKQTKKSNSKSNGDNSTDALRVKAAEKDPIVAAMLAEQAKLSEKRAKSSESSPSESKSKGNEELLSGEMEEISALQAEYDALSAQQAELMNRWRDARERLSAIADAPFKESIPIRDEIKKIESDQKDIDNKLKEAREKLNNAKIKAAKTRQGIRKEVSSDGKPATKEEIKRLVGRLSRILPRWVKTSVLSGEEFARKLSDDGGEAFSNDSGEVCGFVGTDGNVYINADNCKFSTPIHEIGIHKLLDIARENGYDNLKTAIIEYGKNAPEEFKAAVRSAYPNLAEGGEDFYEEVAAHAFGAAFEDRQAEFAKQNTFQRLLQAIKDFMVRLFGGKYARLDAFDGVESMGESEIGDALYNLVMGGRQIAAAQKKLNDKNSVYSRGVRAQILGIKGVRRMAKAGIQAGVDAIDNFEKAVEMSKSGVDSKRIRLTTGWEIGPDGNWKYEISDISVNDKKYRDAVDDILNADSSEDTEQSAVSMSISEIVEDSEYIKELLAAYPELSDISVAFYYNESGTRHGHVDTKNGIIYINAYDTDGYSYDSIRDAYNVGQTLIHEIQHIIQESENWARGGNTGNVKGYVEKKYGYNEKEIRDRIDDLNKRYSDALAGKDKDAIGELSVKIYEAENELERFNKLVFGVYESLYGEAEARLASIRSDYDEDERRRVTLSEDFDIDEDDMIFKSGIEVEDEYGTGSMAESTNAELADALGMSEDEFVSECKDSSSMFGVFSGLINIAPSGSMTANEWVEYFKDSGVRKYKKAGQRIGRGEGRLMQYLQSLAPDKQISSAELMSELNDEYECDNPSSWKNLCYLSGFKTTLYEAWTYLKDDILGYGLIRGSIMAAGGAIGVDFEEVHNTQSSRAQTQIDNFVKEVRTPLLNSVSKLVEAGKDIEEISDYLVALHAAERNRKMLAKNVAERFNSEEGHDGRMSMNDAEAIYDHIIIGKPYRQTSLSLADEVAAYDIFDEYEGDENADKRALAGSDINGNPMTDKRADEIISEFESGIDRDVLDNVQAEVKKATDWIVDKALSYGLITSDMADEYKNQYEHYIPLVDWDSEEDKESALEVLSDGNFNRDYNSSINVDIAKAARGRKSRSFNPIAMIYQRGVSTILTGEENKSRTALYDTVLANQNLSDIFFIDGADIPDWAAELESSGKIDNRSVDVYIDGVKKRMYFAGQAGRILHNGLNGCYSISKRLAKWANNSKKKEDNASYNAAKVLSGIWNGFRGVTAIRSKISTTWNILFNIVNLERDAKYAIKQSYIQYGAKQAIGFAKNLLFGSAFKESISAALGNASSDFNTYLEYGGNIGYSQSVSNEFAKRGIIREINRMSKGRNVNGIGGRIGDILGDIAESFENISRYATFKAAIDNGMTPESAAYAAHQASTNLSRRGTQTLLGGTFMFFNATLEGANQAVRNWFGTEGSDAQRRQAAVSVVNLALTTAWIMMLRAWTNAIDPNDDDDKKNAYAMLPDYVKKDGYVIPFGVDEYGRIKGLRFRYAFQYRVPNYLIEKATECIYGDIDTSLPEFIREAATSAVTEFYPLSGTAMSASGDKGNIALGKNLIPVPTAIKPLLDAINNVNQFGGSIASERDNNRPAWSNAKNGTDVSARAISKFLNGISGGKGEIKKGLVNISPEKLEYIFDSYLGIGGQMYGYIDNHLIGGITGKMTKPEIERYGEKDPVSQRFWYNGERDMMRGRSEDWKALSEDAAKDSKNAYGLDYRELGNLSLEERRELAKSAALTGSESYKKMSRNRDKLEKMYNQCVVRSEDPTLPKSLRKASEDKAIAIKGAIERINAIMGEVYEDKIKELNTEKK